MEGSINKIESMGLSDGPGIRTVIFFSGCMLRCKFCHNPETWTKNKNNVSVSELVQKIKRFKNYYGSDGGVTLSGGEPLLQPQFLIHLCKELKKENISIALDTSGVGVGYYQDILSLVDLVLFDIKAVDKNKYQELTGHAIDDAEEFIQELNESNCPVWIRQVIIPNYNDNKSYMDDLAEYLKKIHHIQKIDLLPYHNMAISKYKNLNIPYPLQDVPNMDKQKCLELEKYLVQKMKMN